MRLRFPLLAGAAILVAGSANAQFLQSFDETLWGVQGSFTPTWQSLDQFGNVISASAVDMSGAEYSIGFARGRIMGVEDPRVYVALARAARRFDGIA